MNIQDHPEAGVLWVMAVQELVDGETLRPEAMGVMALEVLICRREKDRDTHPGISVNLTGTGMPVAEVLEEVDLVRMTPKTVVSQITLRALEVMPQTQIHTR